MRIRAIFSALLLAATASGISTNANAMHGPHAEECFRIIKAGVSYNKTSWFLKVQIASNREEDKIFDKEINLQERPVDIRIGYKLVGKTEKEFKRVPCLLEQYPYEYKNAPGLIVFVPSFLGKTEWEKMLKEAEAKYLSLLIGGYGDMVPNDYAVPTWPK